MQDWYILQSFITTHSSYKAVDFVLCKEGMCTFINSHTVEPPVILLQIVMVSPGTHLVEIHETLSITNESQFKKTRSPKLKMLGPLCNQTVNLETDAKPLHYSLLKLKYSPSIKHNKDWNKSASSSYSHRNDMNRICSTKMLASYGTYAMICCASLGIFLRQGRMPWFVFSTSCRWLLNQLFFAF